MPTWAEIWSWLSTLFGTDEFRFFVYGFFATIGLTQVLKSFIPVSWDKYEQVIAAKWLAVASGIAMTVLLLPTRVGFVLGIVNGTLAAWIWSKVMKVLYHRYPWLETKLSNTPGYDPNDETDPR